ncbi:hypothetical protein A2690_03255 [Candidatus Roizmanbacteria bacterium RIFCSPHIGHO2_01_FULL_39_12b]|uniref:Cell division protein FtsX n=1 Tax=Candidatus Roizmanbacteria bacterium RIFCSPHIGHO2_01_FULL_39_12b TaxID=1802030 RepID=A0A1F7GCK4_9BACT|nr:MAG: hypothetical protein A2690_03255 [Candidatus Roizmanbacteria bacterium RIFCSPHIGHO2_01_FULL_39_12b]OGK46682.1 MAG: hypothetical protein A3B46_02510 [Candidatus Roizmanbacteria bacterium RIFCSPLOWO2_01_FULL_39_19]
MRTFFSSFRRTPYQSFASIIILFFTLLLALFFFNLVSFFYGVLGYVETRPQVIAYFNVETTDDKVLEIKKQIENSGKTSSVVYVSKKQALEIYKNLNKDNPLLIEMVSADILPASIEIYAKRPEYLGQIADYLNKQSVIDEVNYQKDIVSRLLAITTALRQISVFVFSFLILITIIVLMTTTAFKIAVRKDEIELMKLLGASNWYVRKPFLIEGIAFGVISSTLAFLVFFGIFFYVKPYLTNYLLGIPSLPFLGWGQYGVTVWPPSINFVIANYFGIALFGGMIGLIGNYIATSKYIK